MSGRQPAGTADPPLILSDGEAERQRVLLLRLQAALGGLGVQAVLARNHHLGLPTDFAPVSGACGLKSPVLHVFSARDGLVRVQVRDGSFAVATGQSFPVGDQDKAAQEISYLVKAPGVMACEADRAEV